MPEQEEGDPQDLLQQLQEADEQQQELVQLPGQLGGNEEGFAGLEGQQEVEIVPLPPHQLQQQELLGPLLHQQEEESGVGVEPGLPILPLVGPQPLLHQNGQQQQQQQGHEQQQLEQQGGEVHSSEQVMMLEAQQQLHDQLMVGGLPQGWEVIGVQGGEESSSSQASSYGSSTLFAEGLPPGLNLAQDFYLTPVALPMPVAPSSSSGGGSNGTSSSMSSSSRGGSSGSRGGLGGIHHSDCSIQIAGSSGGDSSSRSSSEASSSDSSRHGSNMGSSNSSSDDGVMPEDEERPTVVLHASTAALLRLHQHGLRDLRVVVGMAAGRGVACDQKWKTMELLEQQGDEVALELPLELPPQPGRVGWLAVAVLVGGKEPAAAAAAETSPFPAATGQEGEIAGPSSSSSPFRPYVAGDEVSAPVLGIGIEDEGFGDAFDEGFGDGFEGGAGGIQGGFPVVPLAAPVAPGTSAAALGLPPEAGLVFTSLPLPLLPGNVCRELDGLMQQVGGQGLSPAQAYHMVLSPILQDLLYCLSNASELRSAAVGDAVRVQQMLAPVVTSLSAYFLEHGLLACLRLLQQEYGIVESALGQGEAAAPVFMQQQLFGSDGGSFVELSDLQDQHQQELLLQGDAAAGAYAELTQLQQQHRHSFETATTASDAPGASASADVSQLLLQMAEEVSVAEPASSFSSGTSRHHRRSLDRGAGRRHPRGPSSSEPSAGDESAAVVPGSGGDTEGRAGDRDGLQVGWREMLLGFGDTAVERSYREWKARLLQHHDALMLVLYVCSMLALLGHHWWSGTEATAAAAAAAAASTTGVNLQLAMLCQKLLYPVCMAAGQLLCCLSVWVPPLAVLQRCRAAVLVGAAFSYVAMTVLLLVAVPGLHEAVVGAREGFSISSQVLLVLWWHVAVPVVFRVGEWANAALLLMLVVGQVVAGEAAAPLLLQSALGLGMPVVITCLLCIAVHMALAIYLEYRLKRSFVQLKQRQDATASHLD